MGVGGALVKNEFLREKKWGELKELARKFRKQPRIANRPTNQFSPGASLSVVKSAQHTLHRRKVATWA